MFVDFFKENLGFIWLFLGLRFLYFMEIVDWVGNYLYVLLLSIDFCSFGK